MGLYTDSYAASLCPQNTIFNTLYTRNTDKVFRGPYSFSMCIKNK